METEVTALAANLHQAPVATTISPVVSLRGVCKTIDERPILRQVNLEISPGEYVALLGSNGAGKTTLLKLLSTLTTPTDGQLALFGQPVGRASAQLRRRIGLIDHLPLLYRDLTATENLEFFAALYGLIDPRLRAQHMLARIGLLDRASDPAKTFSRGMLQRLAIGRALLHEPDLLLADEPFAGLDAASVEFVERTFAELVSSGRTVIVVNHDIEQTLRLVDRVIVLRHGKVVVDQPTHRLYLEELVSEVRA